MNIKGFELVNDSKVRISAEGNGGEFKGVGYENEDALLVEYDKRGGLITKDGTKLKTGCFYDFKLKAPRSEFVVEFETPKTQNRVVINTEEITEGVGPRQKRKVVKGK